MGELVAVGDPGTGVGVAEGAGAGVKVEGAVVAVAGSNGVSVGGSWVLVTATRLLVETFCSSVGGTGVSLGATGVCVMAAGDTAMTANSGGNFRLGMLSVGSCPLKKNAPAMMAAMTPVTLEAMWARRARTVSSSRTIGKMVDLASRAERWAMVSETTIAAKLSPARMTSNHDSKDIIDYSRIRIASGVSTMISGAPWYILTWPDTCTN